MMQDQAVFLFFQQKPTPHMVLLSLRAPRLQGLRCCETFPNKMKENHLKSLSIRLTPEELQRLQHAADLSTNGSKAAYILDQLSAATHAYKEPFVKFVKLFFPAKEEAAIKWCTANKVNQADFCADLVRSLTAKLEAQPTVSPAELLGDEKTYHYPLITWEEVDGWGDTQDKRAIAPGRKWAVTPTYLSREAFALTGRPELKPTYGEDKYIFFDILKNPKHDAWVLAKTPTGQLSIAHLLVEGIEPRLSFFPFQEVKHITVPFDYVFWQVIETRKV